LLALLLQASGCDLPRSEDSSDFGLTKVEIAISPEDLGELNNSIGGKRPFPAKVTIDGATYQTEVAYAGRSTLFFYKKSWDIFFKDRHFRGRSSYRLSSPKLDNSVVRATIGFDTFRQAGVAAPETEEVVVYLNDSYLGLHILIEPVDVEFYDVRDRQPVDLYKANFGNADFSQKALNRLDEAFYVETDPENQAPLRELHQVVLEWEPATGPERLSEILDVEQYLRYIAAAVYLNHYDGFDNNYFLARFAADGRLRMTPWDLDRIFESGRGYAAEVSIWGKNHLTEVILSHQPWRDYYLDQLAKLLNDQSVADLQARVGQLSAQIEAAYQADRLLQNIGQESVTSQLNSNIEAWLSALRTDLERQQAAASGL
jgi:spore coat protein H